MTSLDGEGVFTSGNMRIDFDAREVRIEGEQVKLTPKEYGLLYHLSRNVGGMLTHRALLSKVWGKDYEDEVGLLKLHIHNLRRKLGDDLQNPKRIVSKRGVGYGFM